MQIKPIRTHPPRHLLFDTVTSLRSRTNRLYVLAVEDLMRTKQAYDAGKKTQLTDVST